MKISVISARELDGSARARWLELQRCNPALGSPYFCPEFTLAVSDVCNDVRVAVLEDSRAIVGFFPYQARWGLGTPVGRLMSDHHGVICASDTRWQWVQLLRACKLSCWRFDHLCEAQASNSGLKRAMSPGLDLSKGFATYKAGRLAAHRECLRGYERKTRKLVREVGPLRFQAHVDDDAVFDAVVHMKSEQYRRTGLVDIFKLDWTRGLLDRIRQLDLPHFAGRLSALYAGDRLVAAHFGMRSERVWHWWFPVYDQSYARHSPGVELLMHTAEAAAVQGHQLLDLGKGPEPYKNFFADHASPLVEGTFAHSAAAALMVVGPYRTAKRFFSTRLGRQLRPLVRRIWM